MKPELRELFHLFHEHYDALAIYLMLREDLGEVKHEKIYELSRRSGFSREQVVKALIHLIEIEFIPLKVKG